MPKLSRLTATLVLLLFPGCVQQTPPNDSAIEDARFVRFESPEGKAILARLMAFKEGQPRQAGMDADELVERSLLKEGNTCGYIPQKTLEAAEEAYLDMKEHERLHLGAEVMNALLSSPMQLMGGDMSRNREYVHSYQELDVTSLRQQADAFFAPSEQEREDFIRTALFKRMAARIILEDIACNATLEDDMRCAAVECLRHICRDGLLEADGSWPSAYVVDGLPLRNASGEELETVLFGGPAWEPPLVELPE